MRTGISHVYLSVQRLKKAKMYLDLFLLLLAIFVIFGFLGYCWEYAIGKQDHRYIHAPSGTPIPFLPIYGFGGILIYTIYAVVRYNYGSLTTLQLVYLSLIIAFIATIFECLSGLLFFSISGSDGWSYDIPCSGCNGYVNLFVTTGWFILIFAILSLDPIFVPRINMLINNHRLT